MKQNRMKNREQNCELILVSHKSPESEVDLCNHVLNLLILSDSTSWITTDWCVATQWRKIFYKAHGMHNGHTYIFQTHCSGFPEPDFSLSHPLSALH